MIFQDSGAMLNPIRKIGSQYIEYIQKHEKLGRKAAEEKAVAMLEAMRLSEPERIMKSYSFQPVSYTHLDVYKRQLQNLSCLLVSLP